MNENEKLKQFYEYNNKYKKENYDRITMMSPKGTKEKLRNYADRIGISASMFLNEAMREKMNRMDEEERNEKK